MQIASGATFPFAAGTDGSNFVADANGSGVFLVTCMGQHIRCSTHHVGLRAAKRKVGQQADLYRPKFCPAIWEQTIDEGKNRCWQGPQRGIQCGNPPLFMSRDRNEEFRL